MLLCVYDHPLPTPLDAKRPLVAPFGCGVGADAVRPAGGLAGISCASCPSRTAPAAPGADRPEAGAERRALPAGPASLAGGNPAARALRLLEALARGTAGSHALAYLDGRLDVR